MAVLTSLMKILTTKWECLFLHSYYIYNYAHFLSIDQNAMEKLNDLVQYNPFGYGWLEFANGNSGLFYLGSPLLTAT